jgi:type IV secretion system protein VirB8
MLNKKTSSNKIDEAVAHSANFEITVADLARRSEKRAWWVAFTAVALSLILAGGYFYMLPLKEKVPYIVMADAYTGTSTVARLTEDFTNRQVTTSEAINRSNIAHFVLAREAYDYALINLRDWSTVLTMASPQVATAYTTLYQPGNPGNPYATYGKNSAIRVKLLSIVLLGGGQGQIPKGATVRFQRSVYEKITGVTRPLDSKIATMEFTYKANLKMDDTSRIENPLGFQVTNYRVDSDYATAPPEEINGSAPASADGQPQDANSAAQQQAAPGQAAAGAPDTGAAQQAAPAGAAQPQQFAPAGTQQPQQFVPAGAAQPQFAPAGMPQQAPAQTYAPAQQAPAAPAPRNAANGVGRR